MPVASKTSMRIEKQDINLSLSSCKDTILHTQIDRQIEKNIVCLYVIKCVSFYLSVYLSIYPSIYLSSFLLFFFLECVARVPVSLSGSRVEVCSPDVA